MNPPPETYAQAFARFRFQYREQLQTADQLATFDSEPDWLPPELMQQLPPKPSPISEKHNASKEQPDFSQTHFKPENEVKDKQQQKKQTMNGATNEQQKDEKPGFWKRVKNWIGANWDILVLGILLLAGLIWLVWKYFSDPKEQDSEESSKENVFNRQSSGSDILHPDFL
jgi:uncharacterized membrane protein